MQHHLIYQAYGNEGIIAECKFALLQLAAVCRDKGNFPQVIVYTDQQAAFSPFLNRVPIQLMELSNQQLTAWRGSINFVHRVKIEVIKNALQQFGGKILYADTDTAALQVPKYLFEKISPQTVFMHQNEGALQQAQTPYLKKWETFLHKKNTGIIYGNMPATETVMWNAGIIGLHENHFPLLDKVFSLTDSIYPVFPKHTVEQFSFCYTFQNAGIAIEPASPWFFHYWNLKEFRQVLLAFFEKHRQASFQELVLASQQLQPQIMLNQKMAFEKLPPLVKMFKKLSGKEWTAGKFIPGN